MHHQDWDDLHRDSIVLQIQVKQIECPLWRERSKRKGRNNYTIRFGIESAQVEEAVNKEEALATVGVTAVGGRGEWGLNDSSLSYSNRVRCGAESKTGEANYLEYNTIASTIGNWWKKNFTASKDWMELASENWTALIWISGTHRRPRKVHSRFSISLGSFFPKIKHFPDSNK